MVTDWTTVQGVIMVRAGPIWNHKPDYPKLYDTKFYYWPFNCVDYKVRES